MLQMTPPTTPQGPPEEPRSAQERPGRAPRASQNHPWGALRGPLGVQKVSWDGSGSLGPSFLSPQGLFSLIILTFPEPLFSLLFLCSLLFSPFYQTLSDTAQRATVNRIDHLFNLHMVLVLYNSLIIFHFRQQAASSNQQHGPPGCAKR